MGHNGRPPGPGQARGRASAVRERTACLLLTPVSNLFGARVSAPVERPTREAAGRAGPPATRRLPGANRPRIAGPAIRQLFLTLERCRPSNTRSPYGHGQVAQSVEQRTENPRVGGSIPPLATTFLTSVEAAVYQGRSLSSEPGTSGPRDCSRSLRFTSARRSRRLRSHSRTSCAARRRARAPGGPGTWRRSG